MTSPPDHAAFDAGLRDRLLRFLLRERAAGREGLEEAWNLPVPTRVEAGHAIAGVSFTGWAADGRLLLHAPVNQSAFRPGERMRIGSGADPATEPEVQFIDHDPVTGELACELAYGTDRGGLDRALSGRDGFVLDRSEFDTYATLRAALERVFGAAAPRGAAPDDAVARAVRNLLAGRAARRLDAVREQDARRSLGRLRERGVDLAESQQEAFVAAWAYEPYHLVQGPPGTGKTWLLALLLAALAWRGERILVTAQTNLAVDNVLAALARIVREAGRPLAMTRASREVRSALLADPAVEYRRPRSVEFPSRSGAVVGATLLSSPTLVERLRFDRVVFDEAAQVPLTHALCALLGAPRWLFFGDDRQLGPVIVGEHEHERDTAASVFTHLRGFTEPTLLDRTFRMNEAVCEFPSRAFYGGRLRPAESAAARRFRPGRSDGPLADVLDPAAGTVLALIDHEGYHLACPPEVRCVADLAQEFLQHQGIAPDELAIVAPFRLQNREVQRELRRRLGSAARLPVIDTVERIQGQEREVVIVSLTCSDPDALRQASAFFFSPNRLCVTLTRARVKVVVVGSRHLLRTFPGDHEGLRRLDLFHRLFTEVPHVDWTARYLTPSS